MKKIAFKDTSTPDEFENIIKKYRFVSENNPEGLKAVDYILSHEYSVAQKLKENKDQIKDAAPQHSSAALRIYTYMRKIAAAGTGFYFDDIPTDTIEAPYLEGADFIIGVSGDSMEPDYHDGDKLYVKKVEHLNYGEVGIFTINNECYLKEFGSGGLISRNKDYENIPGSEDIRLIGKVIDKLD
jgi:phage repressor protein C with HTH and peptisase S24 domain